MTTAELVHAPAALGVTLCFAVKRELFWSTKTSTYVKHKIVGIDLSTPTILACTESIIHSSLLYCYNSSTLRERLQLDRLCATNASTMPRKIHSFINFLFHIYTTNY